MRLTRFFLPAVYLLTVLIGAASLVTCTGCAPSAEQKAEVPDDRESPPPQPVEPVEAEPSAVPAEPREAGVPGDVAAEGVVFAASALKSIAAQPDGMPPAPDVSVFAPVDDLADQADRYVAGLEKALEGEDAFEYIQEKIGREANTLVIIALALGLHDEPNRYKDRAGALMQTAAELAAATDLDTAKRRVVAVREAADGKLKSDLELRWGPAASLKELMLQVPLVNTRLKRNLQGERFKTRAKLTAGYTAVIAAIAQGSMADVSEAKTPEQVKQWFDFSVAMRDAAGALNAAVRQGDEAAGAGAMKKLAQSCNDCHAVFHPEAEVED